MQKYKICMAASGQASGALPPASEGTGVFLSEQSLLILFLEQRLHIGGLCHFLGRPVQLDGAVQLQLIVFFLRQTAGGQVPVRIRKSPAEKADLFGLHFHLLDHIGQAAAVFCKGLCTVIGALQPDVQPQRFGVVRCQLFHIVDGCKAPPSSPCP